MSLHCCWICGNLYDRRQKLEKIKSQFSSNDIVTFDNVSFVDFEGQVLSSSCFSDKRLFIMKELPELDGLTKPTMVNRMKKLLENAPDDCFIVFYGIPQEEEKAISKHVADLGKKEKKDNIFDFPSSVKNDGEAAHWVMKQFAADSKQIEQTDAQLLVDKCGFDPETKSISTDILRLAVMKTAQFLGRRRNVQTEDVATNIFPSEDFVIWSIFDALDSKDFVRCQNTIRRLLDDKDGDVNGVINLFFNIIQPRYRLIFYCREGIEKKSRADVAKSAGSLLKLKFSPAIFQSTMSADTNLDGSPKAAFSDYGIRQVMGGHPAPVDAYSRKQLVRIIDCIQDCMVEMRIRKTDAELMLLIDTFLPAVCSDIDDKVLMQLRNSDV